MKRQGDAKSVKIELMKTLMRVRKNGDIRRVRRDGLDRIELLAEHESRTK